MNSGHSRRQCAWQIIGAVALVSSLALGTFAYWGLYTPAGRHAYDEMDALYPAAAGALGLIMLAFALLAWWLQRRAGGRP
jgi:hypothetical protein